MKQPTKTSMLFQPVTVKSYPDFFTALAKAACYGFGKEFNESLLALMDAGAALGLEETDDSLAWKLIDRSARQAMYSLVRGNRSSIRPADEQALLGKMKKLAFNG